MKKFMKTTIATLTALSVAALSAQTTSAGDREWATAGKILTGVVAGAIIAKSFEEPPVYHAATVTYAPPPTVVYTVPPPPVLVRPAPVVVYHQPVFVAPAPAVVLAPAPVCAAPARFAPIRYAADPRHCRPVFRACR